MKKKILGLTLAAALILPIGLLATSCGNNNKSVQVNPKEVYAMSAFTSVEYFSRVSPAATFELPRPSTITEANVKSINTYVNMFQGYLLGNDNVMSVAKTEESSPYFEQYSTKITMTMPTITGNESYTLYYKELDTTTSTEVEDDMEETEITTTLSGVIVSGNDTYNISGSRVVEKEGNEYETKITFTTKNNDNENDYITVEQSIEMDEIEYEYKVYKNGQLASVTEIEYETEKNKSELEVEFKDLSDLAAVKRKYSVTKKTGAENAIIVKFITDDNNEETITVVLGENENTFTYANGQSETISNAITNA